MYSTDITEAFVHAQQQELRERAAADRLAHAVIRTPSPAAPKRRRSRPHPLVAFHTWLAAGQL